MQWSVFALRSANRMEMFLRQGRRGRDQSGQVEAADIGCQLLRSLLIDPDFRRDVESAYYGAHKEQEEISRLTANLNLLDPFLEQEKHLLIEADVNSVLVSEAIEVLRENTRNITSTSLDPHEIYHRLRWLKHSTCRLRSEIARIREDQQLGRGLRRIAIGAVGLGLVGLNASAMAASMGISSIGSAMSSAAGGTLFGVATDGLADIFKL